MRRETLNNKGLLTEDDVQRDPSDSQQDQQDDQQGYERVGTSGCLQGTSQMKRPTTAMLVKTRRMRWRIVSDTSTQINAILRGRCVRPRWQRIGSLKKKKKT